MPFSLFPFFFLILFRLQQPISATNLHKFKQFSSASEFLTEPECHADPPPTEYFEVTKPIELPNSKPCSYHILHHDFGFTYRKPPVLANYTPPSDCPSQKFSKIVLEWKATCKARQYDRIFGVWLGGAELLRSCTAEPRPTGIVWTVEKDITRYYSLLTKEQTLAVYLGNIIDDAHTGIYHVDIFIHFYPDVETFSNKKSKFKTSEFGYGGAADLIIPFSRNLPLNDGLWFEIKNSTGVASKEFKIPPNAYRAVLEVYVSFHESDEWWYGNTPNDYNVANNLTDMPGNGPFREVVITLDGNIVGAVWPFTVIYTGGVIPFLWRPITGIGSFNLPTYDIEITPYLGKLLDGETHSFGFSVTNALNVWFIDANLHLWLDTKSAKTEGELVKHIANPRVESLVSDFEGLNGKFFTAARRSIFSTGWVKSSHGKITTSLIQDLSYNNSMVMGKDGSAQTLNQIILCNNSVSANLPSFPFNFIDETYRTFSIYLDSVTVVQGDQNFSAHANFTLGFDENRSISSDSGLSDSSIINRQRGRGNMVVQNNLVVSGVGSTQQDCQYKSNEFCYFRNVSSSNYTIVYDEIGNSCNRRSQSHFGLGLNKNRFVLLN